MTKAAIYARISDDKTGEGLGVARQEEDCRKLADRLGWEVVEVFADNDVSAFSGKTRPAWNRLVEDVKDGRVTAIIAWHLDRLTRQTRELEDVIDLADAHSLKLAVVTGDVDLATASGRMTARIMGAVARQSSEQASERLKRQRRQLAEAGMPHPARRPFGYEADSVTIRESEAVVVREVAARLVAGESLNSVARDLNARGLRTTRGNLWRASTVKDLALSPRYAGKRVHNDVVVGDAAWEPIISTDEHERLKTRLTRPRIGVVPRTYLLSGILRCFSCGAGLVGRPHRGTGRYVCDKRPGENRCGRVAVMTPFADDVVTDLVLRALANSDFVTKLYASADVDPGLRAAIAADERRIELLWEEFHEADPTRDQTGWRRQRRIIEDRLDENRAKLQQTLNLRPLKGLTGLTYDELLGEWATRTTGERRAIIKAVVDPIVVNPPRPGVWRDKSRFDPHWVA